MAKKKVEDRFPRDLYKAGGPEVLYSAGEKYKYSKVLVKNEEDMEVALEAGYADDFSVIMDDEDVPVEDVPVSSTINFEKEDF